MKRHYFLTLLLCLSSGMIMSAIDVETIERIEEPILKMKVQEFGNRLYTKLAEEQNKECLKKENFGTPECQKIKAEAKKHAIAYSDKKIYEEKAQSTHKKCLDKSNFEKTECEQLRLKTWQIVREALQESKNNTEN